MQAIQRFYASSSFIIGLIVSALLVAGILFVTYFQALAQDNILLREYRAAIDSELRYLMSLAEQRGTPETLVHIRERLDDSRHYYFYAVRDANGELVAANLPFWPNNNIESLDNNFVAFEVDHSMMNHHARSSRWLSPHFDIMAKAGSLPNGYEVLVGRNVDELEVAQWVGTRLGLITIIILSAIALLCFGLAYYMVTRINRIAATADRVVSTGNLSERLSVDSSWDDLSKLSLALNRMFAELEFQVNAIQSVSDNIAHDLRTPLTRIRAKIEEVEPAEVRYKLLGDVDVLLGMFNGLLRIAKVENTKQQHAFTAFKINNIIEDLVELYEPLIDEKSQQLTLQLSEISCQCDRDLIFQALGNVLDNAVKFSPEASNISIRLFTKDEQCIVQIADSGPGIPERDYSNVLQRFFRLEESRTTPGFGLGMSLVAAVMKVHQGSVILSSNQQSATGSGLVCELRWPLTL